MQRWSERVKNRNRREILIHLLQVIAQTKVVKRNQCRRNQIQDQKHFVTMVAQQCLERFKDRNQTHLQ